MIVSADEHSRLAIYIYIYTYLWRNQEFFGENWSAPKPVAGSFALSAVVTEWILLL
jgi:hypothetical protein